ncbi:ABC-three component system middle component 1 [Mesobacillus jeotgali]|uniref:Uncharacterized protein n=1 Tax=Mesobacillus jeotgali TaxID=129985 RepID=A0ABY9VGT9_9BACI|nr:ABC-three component system middle component 1 [Mesobacillus jeotgali]WNF23154.1 hypothetical protein RH061_01105 [Mesobacillus jeotgali]
MRQVVKRIFKDQNFKELTVPFLKGEEGFFAVNTHENFINFYLVLFLDKIGDDFLEKYVPDYYYGIKSLEIGYDERMDKNLSLLICLNRETELSELERNREIFQVEEDPYFFKKYVFTYTKKQANELSEMLQKHKTKSTKEIINNIINNKDDFIELKNHPQKNTIYNLCSKLMIKIPFLILERGEEQMEDLEEGIKMELRKSGLLKYTSALLELEEFDDINNILQVFDDGGEE